MCADLQRTGSLDPFPVAAEKRFEADLGFLGNRLPDRERRVEEFFLSAAAALPTHRFLIGGNGWHDKPMPDNVRTSGTFTRAITTRSTARRARSSTSAATRMARYGFSPATRVFEAAGAGACIVTDAWVGLSQFLEPGREVLVANCGAGVAAHVATLDAARARAIGAAARRRVLAEHTYAHRVLQLETLLGESAAA